MIHISSHVSCNTREKEKFCNEICFVCYWYPKYFYPNTHIKHNPDPVSPDFYTIQWNTDVLIQGVVAPPIIVNITRAWAPLGSDRFYSLMRDGFYNNATFFRVVEDFVTQFGIAAIPAESSKWNTTIPDDPVLVSNLQWTMSYATAGPDTRTTQLFINTVDNARLDAYGFAPFAVVVSGFETVLSILNPTPDDSNGIT
jgi:cyclophilin family peptidyl-prolyl cis-trans isomerase